MGGRIGNDTADTRAIDREPVTVSRAAELLAVSPEKVREMLRDGRLRKLAGQGTRVLIDADLIEEVAAKTFDRRTWREQWDATMAEIRESQARIAADIAADEARSHYWKYGLQLVGADGTVPGLELEEDTEPLADVLPFRPRT